MLTSYSDLPESEKESDRDEADKILLIMRGRMSELDELCHAEDDTVSYGSCTGASSIGIGDRCYLSNNMGDMDEWEIIDIEQSYDDNNKMLEPIIHLRMYCNSAFPLYRMTKNQAAERKKIPLSLFRTIRS